VVTSRSGFLLADGSGFTVMARPRSAPRPLYPTPQTSAAAELGRNSPSG
jgi:hypothetical protein